MVISVIMAFMHIEVLMHTNVLVCVEVLMHIDVFMDIEVFMHICIGLNGIRAYSGMGWSRLVGSLKL